MENIPQHNVYVALIHYPVYDKNGREIATCITNLDLHDIARCCATYGVKRFYVVTPMASQREYAHKLMAHWLKGAGSRYNPCRKKALQTTMVAAELEEVLNEIEEIWERKPITIVTRAGERGNCVSHDRLRKIIFEHSEEIPYIIAFGTGWGLTEKMLQDADYLLEPIKGAGEYNHLSVRCAAAITLDRLLGSRPAATDDARLSL